MNWFVFDGRLVLFYFIGALLVWMVAQARPDKMKHPKLLGTAICIASGFDLALGFVSPLSLFLFFTWLIETWFESILKKGLVEIKK